MRNCKKMLSKKYPFGGIAVKKVFYLFWNQIFKCSIYEAILLCKFWRKKNNVYVFGDYLKMERGKG